MAKMIRAGDVKSWISCKRRVWYDHYPPSELAPAEDAFEQLIRQAGEQHEQQVLEQMSERGDVVEATSQEHTQALMAADTPVIYQPVFVDNSHHLVGKPDFLVLTEQGRYQIVDAKLATSLNKRPDLKIQLGLYRLMLRTDLPALAYLGNGEVDEVGEESDAKCQTFLESMRGLLSQDDPPQAWFSYSKCSACPYYEQCIPQFEQQADLSLLYGVDARSIPGLKEQGVHTIDDLGRADPGDIEDVPYLKGGQKKQRAIWQAQSYRSGKWRLVEALDLPEGTWVHFDVESNPLSELGGEVYLWGLLPPPYNTEAFDYIWSDSGEDQDYQAWCRFLDKVQVYRDQYRDLVLAHFANFEVAQIKTYASRYAMDQDERVLWLLGDESPLLDMRDLVKRSLVLPLKSYGLKAICKSKKLVNFQWELEESGSQWSVVRYIDYLEAESDVDRRSIKQEILGYNRDDVKATRALEMWLRRL